MVGLEKYLYGSPEYWHAKKRQQKIGLILILIGIPLLIIIIGIIFIIIGLVYRGESKKEKQARLTVQDEQLRERARQAVGPYQTQPQPQMVQRVEPVQKELRIIEREVVMIQCRHCNTRVVQGTIKCPNCGAKL